MTAEPGDGKERPEGLQDGSGAAKATDAAVRRVLVESRQDLLGFLLRRLGNRDEAEDVLQRFSLRALERASDLRDVHTVRGWLGRILASAIVDHQRRAVRRRRREVAMDQTNIESVAVMPDAELDTAVCNCLYKLLPTLKPDYAEVVWRADILGEPRDLSVLKTLSTYEFAFQVFWDSLRFHGRPALAMAFYFASTHSLSRRAFARIDRPAPSNCSAAANRNASSLLLSE
jgi:DNA-directed RNA polymerase specialized sigma24 family protein